MQETLNTKDLNKALEEVNKIPNINKGGCGIVAVGIRRKLQRGSLHKFFRGFFSESIHIALEADGKHIDSKGVHERIPANYTKKITEAELVKLIKDKNYWTEDFCRENIGKIEKILKVDLSDLKD